MLLYRNMCSTMRYISFLLFYSLLCFPCSAQQVQSITGTWQGRLSVSGTSLRLVINIAESKGALTATMDSPNQGVHGIPASSVTVQHDSVVVVIAAAQAHYAGRIAKDGTSITGTWKQAGMQLPLTLQRSTAVEASSSRRKQEPIPPYPYEEKHVTYANTGASISLSGTLTHPSSGGPFPAVVLISGSGPQDRDETIFGHKPFHVLADALTRKGIAVLRFDDRGVGQSTGDFASATTEDFASDVRAGIAWLQQQPLIDSRRIGLIGHSEGGVIAPMIASQSGDIAFLVLLAAPGISGEEVLYEQAALISKAAGHSPQTIETNKSVQRRLFGAVKSSRDSAELRRNIEKAMQEATPAEKELMQQAGITVAKQVAELQAPWWRFFLTYNPYHALRATRVPVLALNGEKDLQVPAEKNLKAIQQALLDGGNTQVTVRAFPQLNHLFQTATTGSPNEYSTIEETFSPAALTLIGEWIEEHSRR